jgi:hypothetical protein
MNFNKTLINNNIENFNIAIDYINDIYIQINSLTFYADKDYENFFSLVENINKSFENQIINNKQTINNLFFEIKVLFNTIQPESIFYSIANDIFLATENTNTLVNNKFINIQKVVNNINNIKSTKKTNYEIDKKIKDNNKILYPLEEEKNTMTTPITTPTTPMTIPTTTPMTISTLSTSPLTIPTTTPMTIPMTTSETVNIDYTIYIIVAIVVILLIFWFIK